MVGVVDQVGKGHACLEDVNLLFGRSYHDDVSISNSSLPLIESSQRARSTDRFCQLSIVKVPFKKLAKL